jgi:raffinose/stachyose/melibiose transport system substrate-binding protein
MQSIREENKMKTKSKWFGVASMLLVAILLISACGGASEPTAQPTEAAAAAGSGSEPTEAPAAGEEVTLRVLVHQNPPMVEFIEAFNEQFEANNPNITVDMSVVNANDLSTVTQTRLNANDVTSWICSALPMRPSPTCRT